MRRGIRPPKLPILAIAHPVPKTRACNANQMPILYSYSLAWCQPLIYMFSVWRWSPKLSYTPNRSSVRGVEMATNWILSTPTSIANHIVGNTDYQIVVDDRWSRFLHSTGARADCSGLYHLRRKRESNHLHAVLHRRTSHGLRDPPANLPPCSS